MSKVSEGLWLDSAGVAPCHKRQGTWFDKACSWLNSAGYHLLILVSSISNFIPGKCGSVCFPGVKAAVTEGLLRASRYFHSVRGWRNTDTLLTGLPAQVRLAPIHPPWWLPELTSSSTNPTLSALCSPPSLLIRDQVPVSERWRVPVFFSITSSSSLRSHVLSC